MTHIAEDMSAGSAETKPRSLNLSRLARNSASNVIRTGLTSLVAIALPVILTHHLSVKVYGAWVLVLQLGAYVGYLNLGIQTALSKYVAEYQTRRDDAGCASSVSAGLRLMIGAGVLGIILTCVLVVMIPQLFSGITPDLLREVRISVLLVGCSLSVGLCTSVFSAIFLGLQRYHIPMVIAVGSRLAYGVAVCAAVLLHRGLITMAVAAAAANILTSLAEVIAWRRYAGFIHVSLWSVDPAMLRKVAGYCAVLAVWSGCMLLIVGLDVTIVGHYAFNEVAFYSIAGSPTNLILMLIGALTGPLLPATSAISITSSPRRMGDILLMSTRYSVIVLLTTGLPVMVGGFMLLRLWVGPYYAVKTVLFLHVLLLANIVRNYLAPYATMVVATSRQHVATIAALSEGFVNVLLSILLARHLGAIGVALGTLIGAVVGVAMHFAVSMHYTQASFSLSRTKLFVRGILIPSAMALPSVLLIPCWWSAHPATVSPLIWVGWFIATAALAWFVSLSQEDRKLIGELPKRGRLTLHSAESGAGSVGI